MNAMPAIMSAVLLKGHGGLNQPEFVTDYPLPAPGGGKVLFEVHACGMNNTDIWVRQGAYGTDDDPNAIAEGRYTTAGAIAGSIVELDSHTVYLKHLRINGSSQGSRGAFLNLLGYIREGRLSANLDHCFPLSGFLRAQTEYMNKQYFGNLVIVPDRFYRQGSR